MRYKLILKSAPFTEDITFTVDGTNLVDAYGFAPHNDTVQNMFNKASEMDGDEQVLILSAQKRVGKKFETTGIRGYTPKQAGDVEFPVSAVIDEIAEFSISNAKVA